MKIHAHVELKAVDPIGFRHLNQLWATAVECGDGDNLYIVGTITHRADFLRRLAVAATQAADELDAGEQVA